MTSSSSLHWTVENAIIQALLSYVDPKLVFPLLMDQPATDVFGCIM
jgi:hypothetical protein